MPEQLQWILGLLRDIDRDECLELLSTRQVGRIAYCTADGPAVLPVNHVVAGGAILFRVAPDSRLAAAIEGQRVAYQVDDFDEFYQSGWSVLARGTAEFIAPEELPARGSRPAPWPQGERSQYVRVKPETLTGRRVIPG